MLFSCGNSTIPLTIKNEYYETISKVIIGTEYIEGDIRHGESKKITSPVNAVLLRVYTVSNEIAQRVLHLYPHNAHNVITITSQGRIVMR